MSADDQTSTDSDMRAVLAEVATSKGAPAYARLQAARTLLKGKKAPSAPAPEGEEPEPLHPAAAWLADYRFRHPDNIPCPSEHRGVGMHDHQDDERLEVVRKAIDEVLAMESIPSLITALEDVTMPPEARMLAYAGIEAKWRTAAQGRERRPGVDMAYIRACAAGLDSQYWRDPRHYGSLLEPGRGPGQPGLVKRTKSLKEISAQRR